MSLEAEERKELTKVVSLHRVTLKGTGLQMKSVAMSPRERTCPKR